MAKLQDLGSHLKRNLRYLHGPWVKKASGYEEGFAKAIGASPVDETVWDCTWRSLRVEVKKCKAQAWIPLEPYAELLQKKRKISNDLVTLFLFRKGDENAIESFSLMLTSKLIQLMGLKPKNAPLVIELANSFNKHLNIQFRLTKNQIIAKADYPTQ
jgi:hypothetical protein